MSQTKHTIATKATLARLTIRGWAGSISDREATRQVASWANSNPESGRYLKRLLPKESLSKLQTIASAARSDHYSLTMPWDDGAYRLLPNRVFEKWEKLMVGHIEAHRSAKNEFIKNYRGAIEQARNDLGAMFNIQDYPSATQLHTRLIIEYAILPVPDAKHFIADLADTQAEKIRTNIESRIQGQIEDTVTHLYQCLGEAVLKCSERLEVSETGEFKIFRDSIFEHLRATAETLPALNITKNPEIDRLAMTVQKALEDISPSQLRGRSRDFDPNAYERVKSTLEKMAPAFAAYLPSREDAPT